MVRFSVQTQGRSAIQDLTGEIQKAVESSGVERGLVLIFVTATTASLLINENEPGLLLDIQELVGRLAPENGSYRHDHNEGNAHSHLRSILFGHHLVVPVENGRLALGAWQSILLIDFDTEPREREVVVEVMGKKK